MANNDWSHSMKRAGVYFIMPGKGKTWTQEQAGKESPALRQAIEKTNDFFWKTFDELKQAEREKGAN